MKRYLIFTGIYMFLLADRMALGGQALIEGVMIRSSRFWGLVCRKKNGELVEEIHPLKSVSGWLRKPFVKGVYVFFSTLSLGTGRLTGPWRLRRKMRNAVLRCRPRRRSGQR